MACTMMLAQVCRNVLLVGVRCAQQRAFRSGGWTPCSGGGGLRSANEGFLEGEAKQTTPEVETGRQQKQRHDITVNMAGTPRMRNMPTKEDSAENEIPSRRGKQGANQGGIRGESTTSWMDTRRHKPAESAEIPQRAPE